jgi:hypothetical protein
MSFVIGCRTWQALFQEKEDKEKKLAKLERKEDSKKKKEVKKDTAGKSSFEGTSD